MDLDAAAVGKCGLYLCPWTWGQNLNLEIGCQPQARRFGWHLLPTRDPGIPRREGRGRDEPGAAQAPAGGGGWAGGASRLRSGPHSSDAKPGTRAEEGVLDFSDRLSTEVRPRILLVGLRRSSKSCIQKVVFHTMSPKETLFLDLPGGRFQQLLC